MGSPRNDRDIEGIDTGNQNNSEKEHDPKDCLEPLSSLTTSKLSQNQPNKRKRKSIKDPTKQRLWVLIDFNKFDISVSVPNEEIMIEGSLVKEQVYKKLKDILKNSNYANLFYVTAENKYTKIFFTKDDDVILTESITTIFRTITKLKTKKIIKGETVIDKQQPIISENNPSKTQRSQSKKKLPKKREQIDFNIFNVKLTLSGNLEFENKTGFKTVNIKTKLRKNLKKFFPEFDNSISVDKVDNVIIFSHIEKDKDLPRKDLQTVFKEITDYKKEIKLENDISTTQSQPDDCLESPSSLTSSILSQDQRNLNTKRKELEVNSSKIVSQNQKRKKLINTPIDFNKYDIRVSVPNKEIIIEGSLIKKYIYDTLRNILAKSEYAALFYVFSSINSNNYTIFFIKNDHAELPIGESITTLFRKITKLKTKKKIYGETEIDNQQPIISEINPSGSLQNRETIDLQELTTGVIIATPIDLQELTTGVIIATPIDLQQLTNEAIIATPVQQSTVPSDCNNHSSELTEDMSIETELAKTYEEISAELDPLPEEDASQKFTAEKDFQSISPDNEYLNQTNGLNNIYKKNNLSLFSKNIISQRSGNQKNENKLVIIMKKIDEGAYKFTEESLILLRYLYDHKLNEFEPPSLKEIVAELHQLRLIYLEYKTHKAFDYLIKKNLIVSINNLIQINDTKFDLIKNLVDNQLCVPLHTQQSPK